MGVSIHYAGELTSTSALQRLLEEVRALATEAGWSVNDIPPALHHLPKRPPVRAQGLLLKIHPQCEPLNLVFDDSGRLVSLLYLIANTMDAQNQTTEPQRPRRLVIIDGGDKVDHNESEPTNYHEIGLWWASTKTQFAGPAVHIALCKLLRYLEAKYFRSLQVRDEAEYWETGEVERLIERMRIVDHAIDRLSGFLKTRNYDLESGASVEALLEDLLNFSKQIQKDLPHKRNPDKRRGDSSR